MNKNILQCLNFQEIKRFCRKNNTPEQPEQIESLPPEDGNGNFDPDAVIDYILQPVKGSLVPSYDPNASQEVMDKYFAASDQVDSQMENIISEDILKNLSVKQLQAVLDALQKRLSVGVSANSLEFDKLSSIKNTIAYGKLDQAFKSSIDVQTEFNNISKLPVIMDFESPNPQVLKKLFDGMDQYTYADLAHLYKMAASQEKVNFKVMERIETYNFYLNMYGRHYNVGAINEDYQGKVHEVIKNMPLGMNIDNILGLLPVNIIDNDLPSTVKAVEVLKNLPAIQIALLYNQAKGVAINALQNSDKQKILKALELQMDYLQLPIDVQGDLRHQE